MSENPITKLPVSWVMSELGELGKWTSGGTPSRSNGKFYQGEVPWIKSGDLPDGAIRRIDESISNEAIQGSSAKVYPVGSLLVAMYGATIGKLGVTTCPAASNQACAALQASDQNRAIIPYVFYYLLSKRDALVELGQGGAQPNISQTILKALSIPIAPLMEQQRIVSALDERLSELDASVASLERAERNLVRYRAAVLAAACSGTLVLTTQEITPRPLRELIKDLGQGWSPKCDLTKEAVPGEWAVVTTTAVQPLRYLDNQGKLLPSNLEPRPRLEILAGDFLMTRKGPRKRAGVACLVRSTRAKLMVCDTVYRFRHIESAVTANYLEIALNSPAVVAAIDKQKAGISESGVSLTHDKLGEIRIPVPPLAEQERIVAEVDRHLSRADALAASIAQSKRRAQRLRRAILAAAFQGRLVPQDPNDEPACVLLDRIRAQAASAEATSTPVSRRGRRSTPARAAEPVATYDAPTPRRRGRPPGPKNKAKA